MLEIIGILSGLIAFAASIPYIIDIVKGNTKPQRMAWVIFLTLSGISFFAQLAEGATDSLWFPLVLFVQAIIIFALTLKFGVGGQSKFDIFSLVAALCIMLIWYATKSAAVAIVCSVTINTIGKILVAEKTYRMPHTEYLPTWIWSAVASFLAVIAVGSWNWILIITPLQNGITVSIIAGIIIVRRRGIISKPSKV
jgi:hypothetical protein